MTLTEALNEKLLDADSYADWLYGQCMSRQVSESNVHKIAGFLAMGQYAKARKHDVCDLQYVALCDHESEVRCAALDLIREKYLEAKLADVESIQRTEDNIHPWPEDPFDEWKDRQEQA